jgi:O-methyltransferase
LKANANPQSRFFGFDTFEGLPEDWGLFKKGEMAPGVFTIHDERCSLIKGLFQATVPKFLESSSFDPTTRKVLHPDADLFSSTLLVLIMFAGYLKKGDILIFDEFCVPNHEFLAFDIFTRMHNVRYEMLGAVNNYLQVALKIVK